MLEYFINIFFNIYLFVLIQIQDSQCSSDESEELRLVFILMSQYSLATPIESVNWTHELTNENLLRSKKLELIRYTEMLLQAIQDADFETYVKLTDSSITCFEPEAVRLSSSRPIRPDQSRDIF